MAVAIAAVFVQRGDGGDALVRLAVRQLELLVRYLQEGLRAVRPGGLLERREDSRHWARW